MNDEISMNKKLKFAKSSKPLKALTIIFKECEDFNFY